MPRDRCREPLFWYRALNHELLRHRSTAEKSLAEARALLSRREAAFEEQRSRAAGLEQALAQAPMEFTVLVERRRLAPSCTAAPPCETIIARTAGEARRARASVPKQQIADMEPLSEAVRLLSRQSELEDAMGRPGGIRVVEEREIYALDAASRLHRLVEALSPRDVEARQ